MPKSNGKESPRAILYVRVSTEEQAKKGYSIPDQLRELRDCAAREGHQVVEEAVDDGYTGAEPYRPGLTRVMDLARAGDIDLVIAKKRDRFFRSRLYRLVWDRDLEDLGVRLVALNDTGNRFGDAMQDEFAEWEREEIGRRTTDGRLSKARQGKVVAPSRARYGFGPAESGVGWEVDEDKMSVVRRIFRMVAGGASLSAIAKTFDREGIPTPGGARFWDRSFFRTCVFDDVYKPHTTEEIRALVSAEVATGLDPERSYGVSWYNTCGLKIKKVPDPSREDGFRKTYGWHEKPKDEHIAVPVPDSGIPRDLVEAARDAVKNNRAPSRAGSRFWELSGGVALCADCGRRMISRRKPKTKNGKRYEYDYYHCSGHHGKGRAVCENSRNSAAGKLEGEIWSRVRDFLAHPTRLETGLNRLVEEERADSLKDPGPEIGRLTKRITAADRERANYHKMAAREMISFEELEERLREVEEARGAARDELDALNRSHQRLKELEKDRDSLLDHYKEIVPSRLDLLTPGQRHEIYKVLGTEALIGRGGDVEVQLKKVLMKAGREENRKGYTNGINPRSVKTEGLSRSARMAAR